MDKRLFLKTVLAGSIGYALSYKAYPVSLFASFNEKGSTGENAGIFPFLPFISEYNIGDYIPKDQGGKFVQMEIFGTEEDAVIVKKVQEGILQYVYGDPINWVRFEKLELEKSVWLARLYFLPSFARMYYLKKDKSYLNFAMQFLRKWYTENAALAKAGKTRYNWTDMQIAWRCIHLSWLYFLGEKELTQSDKQFIIGILKNHSEVLLEHFGEQPLNEFNHQAHGALAMLYTGTLFPYMPHADSLVKTANRILEHHIRRAFYEDGGNVEQMFGYYPFEAHLFRDAYLLCKSNNIAQPQRIEELLRKMYDFITNVKQPDETMPVVNDSYEMPTSPIRSTIASTLGNVSESCIASKLFAETQIGTLRNRSWYVLANPAKTIGAHMHAGRLAFNFWYKNMPVLRDSGCCNYDDPLLVTWYRTSKAHNTVLIDGKSDAATSTDILWAAKRETGNKITDFEKNEDCTFLRMHSPASEEANSSVEWYRSLVLINDKYLILHDFFKTAGKHDYELLFHFDKAKASLEQNRILSVKKEETIFFVPADKNKIKDIEIKEGLISIGGKTERAPMAVYRMKATGDLHSFIVFAPKNKPEIHLKEFISADGAALQMKEKNNRTTTLLLPNTGCEHFSAFGKQTSGNVKIYF